MQLRRTWILLGAGVLLVAGTEAAAQQRTTGSGIRVTKEVGVTPGATEVEVVAGGDVSMLTPFSLAAYANLTEANMTALMAAGDSLEIQLGQLAQSKGTAQSVRDFGAMLVTDHSAHLTKTMEIVVDEDVGATPPMNDPEGLRLRQILTQLRNMSAGSNWDATFLRFQAQHHQNVIDILNANVKNAHDDDMEDHIENTLSSLAKHRDRARSVGAGLGLTL